MSVFLGWGPNNHFGPQAGSVRLVAVLRWSKGEKLKEQMEEIVFTVAAKPE